MQRKLVNFIYLCMQIPSILQHHSKRVLEVVVSSIPILHNQSIANFAKTLTLVLHAMPQEAHRPILKELLCKSPYQDISQVTLSIMI